MNKNKQERSKETKAKGKNELLDGKKEKCPECGGTEFCHDDQTGETYCKSCSLVIDQKVDLGKDYTSGEGGDDKQRRHGPPGKYIDGGSVGSTF